MKNKQEIILYLSIFLSIISLIYSVIMTAKFKSFYCYAVNSVFVERRFNREIIKDLEVLTNTILDWDTKVYYPNGEEVINPLTTKKIFNCN